ncbi:MAG: hypothetical protein U0T80_08685 [Flavobacteriaceae bacterium]
MNLKELGHLWYGDKAIGDFVKIAEKNITTVFFVLQVTILGENLSIANQTFMKNLQ